MLHKFLIFIIKIHKYSWMGKYSHQTHVHIVKSRFKKKFHIREPESSGTPYINIFFVYIYFLNIFLYQRISRHTQFCIVSFIQCSRIQTLYGIFSENIINDWWLFATLEGVGVACLLCSCIDSCRWIVFCHKNLYSNIPNSHLAGLI